MKKFSPAEEDDEKVYSCKHSKARINLSFVCGGDPDSDCNGCIFNCFDDKFVEREHKWNISRISIRCLDKK